MHRHFRISGTGFKRSSWGLLGLGAFLIVVIWSNLIWTHQDMETRTVRELEIHLGNITEALALQADSVLRSADNVLLGLRREYQTRNREKFEVDTQRYMSQALAGFALQTILVDRKGALFWASEAANLPMQLEDRDYFLAHAQQLDHDSLYIGRPIFNRISNRWTIPLSRPLTEAGIQGRPSGFAGVIMLSLDPRHFATLLQRVDLGASGRIAIVSSQDGSYLVRNEQEGHWLGKRFGTDPQLPFLEASAPDKGIFRQVGEDDGIERLFAYQRMPQYGLTVISGVSPEEHLNPIRRRAHASYALAIVVTALFSMLMLYLFRLLRRHAETEAELETEHYVLQEAERIGQVGSWQWDLDNNRLTGSEQLHRLFCFEETWGVIPTVRFQERIHPDDRERVRATLREARRQGMPLRDLEYRIVTPDGQIRNLLACGEHLREGNRHQMIGTVQDVTNLRASEKKLMQAQIVFDNAQEAVVVSDPDGIIQMVNPAFERITGYSRHEAVGHRTNLLASGRHSQEFYKNMWDCLRSAGHWEGEIWNRRKSGILYVEWLAIRAVRDAQGDIQQYVAVFSDITDRKRKEEAVWHQAYHDALTGLPNRSLFKDRLEHAITSAQRDGTCLGLLFIDLDRFKEINDTLGHAAGDELLKQVAERLRACMRASDTVARLAGDEFMALVENIPDRALLARLAEKLLGQLNTPFILEQQKEVISASIGIALYPEHGTHPDSLTQAADQAMYAAKRSGRNAYSIAPSPTQEASAPDGQV